MCTMNLFTEELTKSKIFYEKLTKNCELLQTEVNLLNKLLIFEQKFSDHLLNDLFVIYEKNFVNLQENYRYFDAWNQLQKQKSLAKQNEIQVKKLRQELKSWRKTNHRLNDDIHQSDHCYSSGTDSMTVVKENDTKRQRTESAVSSESQTSTIVKPIGPEVSSGSSVAVKMEIIPKTEPQDCMVCEETIDDTDSASEGEERVEDSDCYIEGVEPTPVSTDSSQPFCFVSEYLSKNKAFSHLLDKNKEQSPQNKAIAIDLNTDSDNEINSVNAVVPVVPVVPEPTSKLTFQSVDTIFDDSIIDLTPKQTTPKKSFIKKRVRFGKKRKTVKTVPKNKETTESETTASTSIGDQRIIGSNHKKIHFNADNTISIIELKGSAVKKSSQNKDTQISIPNPMSGLSRTLKARDNEDYIKATKKIVLKGKVYYCRWKGCSYNTQQRGNAIRHHRRHTGETPFKCEVCPQGFRDKRNLATHVMTHNAELELKKCRKPSVEHKSWKNSCLQLLNDITKSGDSIPFRSPIDLNQYPDYSHVINTPMDLKTVEEKLMSDLYDSPTEFYSDMRLIIDNSKTYNTNKKSRIYGMTVRISNLFEDKWRTVYQSKEPSRKVRGTGDVVCPECGGKYHNYQHMFRHMRRIHGKPKADKYRQQYYKQKYNKQNTSPSKRSSIEKSPKTRLELSLKSISPNKFYKKTEIAAKKTEIPPKKARNSIIPESEGVLSPDDNEWKCDFMSCSRSYSSKNNLKRHQFEIHQKLSKPLFYGTVQKSGKVVKYFIPKTPQTVESSPKKKKTTERSQPPVPQKPGTAVKGFVCNIKNCKNSYHTISGLYKHKKRIHMSKTDWSSVAQKAKRIQKSTTAQLSVEGESTGRSTVPSDETKKTNTERIWSCPEPDCRSRFVWAKNLRTHMKEKHKIFDNSDKIRGKVADESGGQSFACTYADCPFTATSRTVQISHYRTHFSSDDKPFKCLIKDCPYSSQKMSLLKYHVLNRHSEQQFFKAMEETGVHYPSWY